MHGKIEQDVSFFCRNEGTYIYELGVTYLLGLDRSASTDALVPNFVKCSPAIPRKKSKKKKSVAQLDYSELD